MIYSNISENIIKGIIVANSRTGITAKEISNAFYKCTGETCEMLRYNDAQAIKYLNGIPGILSIYNDRNELLWYVRGKTFKRDEESGKIYRVNHHTKVSFDCSKSQNSCSSGTCSDENNNNNKTNKYTNYNRNNIYNNMVITKNATKVIHPNNNDSQTRNFPKTSAALYNYDLVGDDFFLQIAKIDLGLQCVKRNRILRNGLCISGQTIQGACEQLERLENVDNMKIILNLGSVDILHGQELVDMYERYRNLLQLCEKRGIVVIITTLAPLANHCHDSNIFNKWSQFNRFLRSLASKYKIIDIVSCMVCNKSGKLLFECYQPKAKYVSGSAQPHTLWNRIGRQRILKQLKASLPF